MKHETLKRAVFSQLYRLQSIRSTNHLTAAVKVPMRFAPISNMWTLTQWAAVIMIYFYFMQTLELCNNQLTLLISGGGVQLRHIAELRSRWRQQLRYREMLRVYTLTFLNLRPRNLLLEGEDVVLSALLIRVFKSNQISLRQALWDYPCSCGPQQPAPVAPVSSTAC